MLADRSRKKVQAMAGNGLGPSCRCWDAGAQVLIFSSIITVEVEGGGVLGVPGRPGQHTEPQESQDSIETPQKKQTNKPGGRAVRTTHTEHLLCLWWEVLLRLQM